MPKKIFKCSFCLFFGTDCFLTSKVLWCLKKKKVKGSGEYGERDKVSYTMAQSAGAV